MVKITIIIFSVTYIMNKKGKKITIKSAGMLVAGQICILLTFLFISCNGNSSGPYISVDGEKISMKDIKERAPHIYRRIQKQYNDQVFRVIEEMALEKMIKLEAKEKGLKPDEYHKKIAEGVKEPSPAEIEQKYIELKKSGSIGKENLNKMYPKLSAYIKKMSKRKLLMIELSRLKKKYSYKVYAERFIASVKIDDEPFRLNPKAAVTIVEFSDFECPYCIRSQITAASLRKKYGHRIKWVFKDFPLQFHPNAMGAHVAANCIFKQSSDLYWKFFDEIFSANRSADALKKEELQTTASNLGVDMKKYSTCLENPKIVEEIRQDMKEGELLGVSGTPAFFINGQMLSGARPQADFEKIIDAELSPSS